MLDATITPGEHAPARLVSGLPPAQVDYRQQPSAGNVDAPGSAQVYGQTLDAGAVAVAPPTDETFKAYDSPTDALRFNGINSPAQQHAYLSSGDRPGGWADER